MPLDFIEKFKNKPHSVANPDSSSGASGRQAPGFARQLGGAGNAPVVPVVQQPAVTTAYREAICADVQNMLMEYMKNDTQFGKAFCLDDKRVGLVATLFDKSAAEFTNFLKGKHTTALWLASRTPEQFGDLLTRFIEAVNLAPKTDTVDMYRQAASVELVNSVIDTINQRQTGGCLVLVGKEGVNQSPKVVWQANTPVAAALVTAGRETSLTPRELVSTVPKKPVRNTKGAIPNNLPSQNMNAAPGQEQIDPVYVVPAAQLKPVTQMRKALKQNNNVGPAQAQIEPVSGTPAAAVGARHALLPQENQPLPAHIVSSPILENSDPEREALANTVLSILQDYLTTPGLHSARSHRERLLRDLAFEQRDDSSPPWRIGDFLALGEGNQLSWMTEPSLKQLGSLPGALRKSGHSGRSSPLLSRLSKALAASPTSIAPLDAGRFAAPAMPVTGTVNAGQYTAALKVFENYVQTSKGRQRLQKDLSKSWVDSEGDQRTLGEFIRVEGQRVRWAGSPTTDDLQQLFYGCGALGHRDKGRLLQELQQALGQAGVAISVDEKLIDRIASKVTPRPLLKNAIQNCLRQLLSGKTLGEDSPEIVALVSAYADQEMTRLGVEEELSKNYRPDDWKIHYQRKLGFLPHRTSEEVRRRTEKITRERQRLAGLANRFVRQGAGTDRFLDMLGRLFDELRNSNSPVVKNLNQQRLQQQKDALLNAFQKHWGVCYGRWANAAEAEFARRLDASQRAFSATQLGKIKKPNKYQAAQEKVDHAFTGDTEEYRQLHSAFEDLINRFPVQDPMKTTLRGQLQENRMQSLPQREDASFDGLVASFCKDVKTISAGSKIERARQIRARENDATNRLEAMLRKKMSTQPDQLAAHKLAHAKAVAAVKAQTLQELKTIEQQPFSFKSFVKGLSFKGPLRSIATVLGGGLSLVGLVAMALPSAQVLAIVCLIGGASLLTYGVGGAVLASLASTGHSVEKFFITQGARWESYRADRRVRKLQRRHDKIVQKQQKRQDKEAAKVKPGKVAV